MNENQDIVLIEIVNGTQMAGGWACDGCNPADGGCGPTTDFEQEAKILESQLKEEYGDIVQVKYVDVDQVGIENYLVVQEVLHLGYRYPITLINNQPKIAGGIMKNEIRDSINEILGISDLN